MSEEDTEAGVFRDIARRLADWAEQRGLADAAMRGCAACFQSEGGVVSGWTAAEVRPEFRAHSLCFTSALLSYPYVTTALALHAPDGTGIGTYRLITALDGSVDDDYFVIEVSKAEYEERRDGIRLISTRPVTRVGRQDHEDNQEPDAVRGMGH